MTEGGGMRGMTNIKFEYLENEKNFLDDELKSIYHDYLRLIIC